jgi:subtilisin-like proprotein convertase family protein
MRRVLLPLSVMLLATSVQPSVTGRSPQNEQGSATLSSVTVGKAVAFGVSKPARELPAAVVQPSTKVRGRERQMAIKNPIIARGRDSIDAYGQFAPDTVDPVKLAGTPGLLAPPVDLTFEGISNLENPFLLFPPDTDGDVGPNHFVQAINVAWRVFSKTGAPLTPVMTLASLWQPLPGAHECDTNRGDPITLYDQFADRWLITQFGFAVDGVGNPVPPFFQCVAVSQTGDPTGAYFLYAFQMPNTKFNDYPKFGVWPNPSAYFMTDNQFQSPAFNFAGAGVFAFDRNKILAGDPTAAFIYFDLQGLDPSIGGMLPADADGSTPPPAGSPGLFSYFTATEFGDAQDGLRLFAFQPNFTTPASSTFTELPSIAVAAFDPRWVGFPGGTRDDIEQPPPASAAASLDSISDRLMHRLQYRNFGTHESMVVNHTVNVGTGTTLATHQAGVRYYELRKIGAGNWAVQNQGTFAPDADNRWMGSAALDQDGNLALGYSVSSLTTFPSIRYTGRLATDPANTLQAETSMFAGTGSQTNTGSRWGDYSAMHVDPVDDCTFWYTQEYYQTSDTTPGDPPFGVNWQTRIGKFKFPECGGAPTTGTVTGTITACTGGTPVAGATVMLSNGASTVTNSSGVFLFSGVAPGSYTITVSAPGFQTTTSGTFTVTAGQTTTVNLCLPGVPLIVGQSATLQVESCPPANQAIDPDERVGVAFTLRNNGGAPTSNLVATLLPTGGVTAPSEPESYGAIAPGATATRTLSFTATGACGSQITMTLGLQDGATNLGTVTFTATLGALTSTSSSNTTPIVFPVDTPAAGDGLGPATPYPSNIAVAGVGVIEKVTVTLSGIEHTFPDDIDMLLVGPGGQKVMLMSDAGGSLDVNGLNLTFDDAAASSLPGSAQLVSGTFKPSNYAPAETLPAPAPAPPYGGALSVFSGTNANGTWSLYGFDQFAVDDGSIAGGWTLTFSVRNCTSGCALVRLSVNSTLSRNPSTQNVSAAVTVTNVGSATANSVMLTGATLGTAAGSPVPQSLGNLAPGASATVTVNFGNVPPGPSTLRVNGTHAGGAFNSTKRVTVP